MIRHAVKALALPAPSGTELDLANGLQAAPSSLSAVTRVLYGARHMPWPMGTAVRRQIQPWQIVDKGKFPRVE